MLNAPGAWQRTRSESHKRAAEVTALEKENASLKARKKALSDPAVLEEEARKLGMVRPGERGYVVKDLPKGP